MIDGYLKEDLIFYRDIPQAYIRIGNLVENLISRREKVMFSVKQVAKVAETASKDELVTNVIDSATNKQLKEIQERCYNDLLEICRNLAAEKNVTLASIMNMHALKAMAEKLPECEKDMLAIPHVTKANFEKYGQQLLQITQNFAAEKIRLMLDMNEPASPEPEPRGGFGSGGPGSDDDTDWNRLANHSSGPQRGGGRAPKRFGNWKTGNHSGTKR